MAYSSFTARINTWKTGKAHEVCDRKKTGIRPIKLSAEIEQKPRKLMVSERSLFYIILLMDKNPAAVDMVNICKYSIIYRVSYMSGGAGFLPSAVSHGTIVYLPYMNFVDF